MKRADAGKLLAVAALAAACTSPNTGPVPASPTHTAPSPATAAGSPSAIASPTPTPSPLVIVRSADGYSISVEDLTDPSHPKTVDSFPVGTRVARFISATEIGYTVNSKPDSPTEGETDIYRLKLPSGQPVRVATVQGDVVALAWNPDGSSMAFIAYTGASGENHRLWLTSRDSEPRTITPLIPVNAREFVSTDQIAVAFSPDGQYLLMVDTTVRPASSEPTTATLQVRQVADGRFLWAPASALRGDLRTSMAVWSRTTDRLYFQDPDPVAGQNGIHIWEPFDKVFLLTGLNGWTSPSVSSTDRFVAYEFDAEDGRPQIAVRDLTSDAVRRLTPTFGRPLMLSDSRILERHFVRQIAGAPGPGYLPDRYYVLDLATNQEVALPSDFQPLDFWLG